jgi:hypothetical protein
MLNRLQVHFINVFIRVLSVHITSYSFNYTMFLVITWASALNPRTGSSMLCTLSHDDISCIRRQTQADKRMESRSCLRSRVTLLYSNGLRIDFVIRPSSLISETTIAILSRLKPGQKCILNIAPTPTRAVHATKRKTGLLRKLAAGCCRAAKLRSW